jgi:hypothetical protein
MAAVLAITKSKKQHIFRRDGLFALVVLEKHLFGRLALLYGFFYAIKALSRCRVKAVIPCLFAKPKAGGNLPGI